MPSIAQVIDAAYAPALHAIRGQNPFVSRELNALCRDHRIIVAPLGPWVEVSGRRYEVDDLRVGVAWTSADDRRLYTVNDKVRFVQNLISQAWDSHDIHLLDFIGDGAAVVSRDYRYLRGELFMDNIMNGENSYRFNITTGYAAVRRA